MSQRQAKVDTPCAAYNKMARSWSMLHDLLGGTRAMRNAGERWLPRESEEQPELYDARLNRSFLFNGFGDTLGRLGSKPFRKPVTLQGDVPEQLAGIETDADGQGMTLTQAARQWFDAGLVYGLTHVLVDYPVTPEGQTLADERKSGARPQFIHVDPTRLIGWRTVTGPDGRPVLDQIRFKEGTTVQDGDWGEKEVDRIRVYTRDDWTIYEANDKGEYAEKETGTHTFGAVPLVTFYTTPTGMLTARPPLEDLAWLNVEHWQSSSDQRNILHFGRAGLLFGKGLNSDDVDKPIVVGPNQSFMTTAENAELKYVEHTGQAIGAGAEDIQRIEERMEILGLQPLMRKAGGNATATGQVIDESNSQCDMEAWVRSLENMIRQAYEMAAKWIEVELADDFKADVFSDFAIGQKAAEDIRSLIQIRQAGEISRTTFLREIKRRALLAETVDVEVEITAIENEGPPLGSIGVDEGDGDDG